MALKYLSEYPRPLYIEIVKQYDKAVKYIEKHKEINNVLISGGDVLSLPTKLIRHFLEMLSPIKHINFIRFGSRIPVAFPYRIINDDALLSLLKKYSKPSRRVYVVTHFNHPREITSKSITAVDRLINANVMVNNQTVLLKGVNDNSDVLAELMSKLVSIGVIPYYLFQCRPVKRVKHHFQVSLYNGIKIVEDAKKKLNGHAKRFKYVMSHRTGKIEIIGTIKNDMYFKYHQAKKIQNKGKLFKMRINKKESWLNVGH